MAAATWTLLDSANDIYTAGFTAGPADVGLANRSEAASPFRVRFRCMRGGRADGIDCVEIDNGVCRINVLPTRGMGIHRAEAGSVRLGWQSPVPGPVHPKFVPLMEPSGLGWLFGFDELLCRCGLESNGPPVFDQHHRLIHPLHGRIANTPAHKVVLKIDPDQGLIEVCGETTEARLFHNSLRMRTTVRTRLGEPGFTLIDEVTNFSAEPSWLALLYHINIGSPWLQPGSQIKLPVREIAPRDAAAVPGLETWQRYPAPKANFAEQVFYTRLAADAAGQTQVLLHDAEEATGVGLKFNVQQLPWFVLWKNMRMPEDGYVTGLEPALNLPNHNAFEREQDRVRQLAPGETVRFELAFEVYNQQDHVEAAAAAIDALQGGRAPIVHGQPHPNWSPGA